MDILRYSCICQYVPVTVSESIYMYNDFCVYVCIHICVYYIHTMRFITVIVHMYPTDPNASIMVQITGLVSTSTLVKQKKIVYSHSLIFHIFYEKTFQENSEQYTYIYKQKARFDKQFIYFLGRKILDEHRTNQLYVYVQEAFLDILCRVYNVICFLYSF